MGTRETQNMPFQRLTSNVLVCFSYYNKVLDAVYIIMQWGFS